MEANTPELLHSLSPLAKQSFVECEAMARYALSSGLRVSGVLLQRLKSLETAIQQGDSDPHGVITRRLGECHSQLARIIAPATPRTILLLDSEMKRRSPLSFLGPVPLTRQMMLAALISLVVLICLTLSPEVNGSKHNTNILLGSGLPLLLNELFMLSAAALGASFSALFVANQYIQEGTFDPKYNISYWIRFVLGLIAGFVLATLIDVHSLQMTGIHASAISPFALPALAMLGGFSASLVHRILSRVAESVESVFRGDPREHVRTRADAERGKLKVEADQDRSRLAYRLMVLQQKMSNGESHSALQSELDALVRDLIGELGDEGLHTPVEAETENSGGRSFNQA